MYISGMVTVVYKTLGGEINKGEPFFCKGLNKGEPLFKRYVVYGYTFWLQIENMEFDSPVSLMFYRVIKI